MCERQVITSGLIQKSITTIDLVLKTIWNCIKYLVYNYRVTIRCSKIPVPRYDLAFA